MKTFRCVLTFAVLAGFVSIIPLRAEDPPPRCPLPREVSHLRSEAYPTPIFCQISDETNPFSNTSSRVEGWTSSSTAPRVNFSSNSTQPSSVSTKRSTTTRTPLR